MELSVSQLTELRELRFTFGEGCARAGVPVGSPRNWERRGLVKLGRRHSLFQRQVLSGLDVLRLSAMHQLQTMVAMGPADAAEIADLVVRHAEGTTFPGRRLILQRDASGAWLGAWADIPAPYGGPADAPHVIVPIETMILGVMRRLNAVARPLDGAAGPRAANVGSRPGDRGQTEEVHEAGNSPTNPTQEEPTP